MIRKTGLLALVIAMLMAGTLPAGEISGLTIKNDGTVSVVKEKEVCGNSTEENPAERMFHAFTGGLSGGLPISLASSETEEEELIKVLKETNRILSEIRDELAKIEKYMERTAEEKSIWGRVPVR